MKKITAIAPTLFSVTNLKAQNGNSTQEGMYFNQEVFHICATILVVLSVMIFLLAVLKCVLEYRLKNKIVEKGIPDTVVSSLLPKKPSEDRHSNVKWFAVLTGSGIGLTIINYTQPLGFHSLAIMCFSIAGSFLVYSFYLRQSGK